MRPEFPLVHDVGQATNGEDTFIVASLLEHKEKGHRLAVPFYAGSSYWKDGYSEEFAWLKDYRVYTFSEIGAFLDE